MKVIIASDLHGSNHYLEKLIELKEKENAKKLILLGDIYNHGPRNPLPKDYNPIKVSEKLNAIKQEIYFYSGCLLLVQQWHLCHVIPRSLKLK